VQAECHSDIPSVSEQIKISNGASWFIIFFFTNGVTNKRVQDGNVDQVRVNLRDGEHDQGGRRAVAGLLDPVFIHHTHGDAPAVPNLLVILLF